MCVCLYLCAIETSATGTSGAGVRQCRYLSYGCYRLVACLPERTLGNIIAESGYILEHENWGEICYLNQMRQGRARFLKEHVLNTFSGQEGASETFVLHNTLISN